MNLMNTIKKTLVDSSFLYALFSVNDRNHSRALKYSQRTTDILMVPDVILPEVTFLFRRKAGASAVSAFLRAYLRMSIQNIMLTRRDVERCEAIMSHYRSAQLDFVDCAIMAFAERLDVFNIATFDRRDFSIVQPAHTDYFTLVP